MSFVFRVSEEVFTSKHMFVQESSKVMNDFGIIKSKSKKPGKTKKEVESSFMIKSNDLVKNRREKEFIGSYCKETFRKHKNWRQSLSKEEQNENDSGLLIEKPKETYKAFNSIEQFDVIGCLKVSQPHYPRAYIVLDKDKEDERLLVIPWNSSWLETEHTKETITHHFREYTHQNKSLNLDNSISIEDISLSVSLERFVKLYKFDKNDKRFTVPVEDSRKVRIVRYVSKEETKPPELST